MLTRLALAILVVFVMIISVAPMAIANSVGNMPGSFQVGHNGDAQYSIPIWTPPGIHGVQPNLALVYDSHSGLGTMGPGWSISGLSSIYRCNSTYAQDGTPSAITLTLSDRFCLDRKRLRLTSTETLSDYGAASTTYQTEVADFSLVTASSTETENGPSSFTVQGKDGLTYEYGATTSSQIFVPGNGTPYIWALDKVTDRAGNYMTYTYTQTNGSYVISSIQYTAPSGSTTFLYQVEFKYTTLPAGAAGIRTRYLAGGQVQQTQELNSITVQLYGTTTDLRLYSLGYSASPTTARDTLTTITECGGSAGTDCLPATTIGYQSGTAGVASPATSTGSGTTNGAVYSVDMDGDGRQDFLFAVTSGSNIEWWVQLATSTGYKAPINTGAVTTGTTNVLVDTFEGTPQNEILVPVSGIWYEYKCPDLNCTAFTATSTKIAVTTAAQYSSADVDGDGRPDLVSLVPGNPDVACVDSLAYPNNLVSVQLNTMTSSLSFADTPVVTYASCASEYESPRLIGNNQMQTSSVKKMDFDGDGRQDLMLTYTTINDGTKPVTVTSGAIQLLSRGTGAVGAGYSLPGGPLFAVNWNDDACTDMIALETGSTTAYEVYTSTCNGASGPFIPLTGVTPVLALDWDGDGRTDILGNVGGNFEVYRSEGSAVAAGVSTGISVGSGNYTVTDQNGDGLDDLVLANSANNYSLTYGLHAGANTLPDLATSFTDAYGNVVKPWYTSIVPGDGTTFFPQNAVSFPYQNFLAPYYVTGAATFSDPTSSSNGTYTIYYYFAGASLNLQGRGFSMGTIQTYDPRSGIWDTRIANFVFPYTGMPSYEIADLANSTSDTLHSNNWTLKEVTLDATANNERYFPYIFNVLKETNEPSEANYPEITSASTTYTYDNYGNATNVSTVTTDEDTGSPYYGDTWTSTTATTITADTSTWCLDVPTETQVTNSSTAPGGAAITRTVTYTPDYSNCRVSGKVTAPGTSYQVSEVYGFDAFGNVNSDAVTGTGMATRTTGITWGTTGQFPTIIKNAFGQSITLTYDPNTGNPLSQTDPNYTTANPLQTTWKYDDFGRKSQETRPDGTYTTWTYENCASWGGCLLGTYGLDIFQQVFGSNGTVIQSGTTEYDALNRPILWNKLLINDTYDLNEVKYDNLGRIASQAEPCAWGGSATTLCPYWITYQYDVLNRMTESQRPISATNSTLQTTQYGYAGRTSTVKDALSNTTTKITLVTGKMARSTDPKGYYQNFTYDAFGSLTAVTDSASNALFSATYAYGIGAFQTATTDMDMGAWTYTVDPLGEVTGHKDAKNQSFSQSYDLLSRPLVRTEPDLTTTWTWGTSAASYNIGQLASISSTQGSVTYSEAYTYDNKTRLSGKSITIPGDSTYAYSYAYNPTTGLPSSLTYPASSTGYQLKLNYGYSYGILTSVTDATTGTAYWTADTTNPRGQVTQETLGNGVVTNRAFDAVTTWVSSIQAGVGGGTALLNSAFTYDELGDVTQRQNNNAGLTENFYYDTDYRLDHSTLNGTINLQMVYDTTGMGNIASRSDVAGGAAWTYDPVRKHAVTQAGSSSYVYTYDANGNQITRSGNQVSWTSYNYPSVVSTSSESATFQYGPYRDRWQTVYTGSIGTETTYHVGKLLEKVANAGVVTYRYYIYAGSEPVAVNNVPTSGSATLTYVLEDHQGTPASLATSAGTLDVAESFTAFGNRRNGETWSGAPTTADENAINAVSRQGYTWQTMLGVSMGLNHMNGRIQDAVTGRFLSPDPRIPNQGNTQDFNRYSYADNNPLTFTDPSGFDDRTCPTDGGCGGAGSGGVTGWPDQNSWDCYGNCGNGNWANSIPSSAGSDPLSIVGQVASIVAQSAADAISDPSNWTSADGDMTSASNDSNFDSAAGSAAAPAQSQLPTITVTGNNSALSSNFFDPSSLGTNAGAQFWPQINSSGNQLAPVTVTARRSYVDNYVDFVSTYAINVGPYATALAGGLWPKSWAPATNFRPPLLGSTNPLTSVPRAFGMAGADSVFVQTGAAGIGLLTVGIGFYDIGIELEGFIYALPDVSAPAPSPPIFPY